MSVSRKSAEEVTHAITQMLEPIKDVVLSFTFDNGREFAAHEVIAGILGCKTYFAKSYHSWKRRQNEKANGLLRQFYSKSRQLNDIEVVEVLDAIDKLNSRPRKCLGYRTPYETFEELTGITKEKIFEGYALIT